jgi:hypothetical protein
VRLTVRRKAAAPPRAPVNRLAHQLLLGGHHATAAANEIGEAARVAGSVNATATALGVAPRTLYRWQAQHAVVATALREALST